MLLAEAILNVLAYMSAFVLTYFSVFLILAYLFNKECVDNFVGKRQWTPFVSIIIPMYNEGREVHRCIDSLLALDYPKDKYEIIVVDDCSTDNSYEVVKQYESKGIKLYKTPKNTGHAAGSKNYGVPFCKGDVIAFLDSDSFVAPDVLNIMLPYFEEGVGVVTPACRVWEPHTIMEKLQFIEFEVILFLRRIFMALEAVYVTPGPFSMFTREAFESVGGFDEKSFTEDHEIALSIQAKGYMIRSTVDASVHVIQPDTIKGWLAQRVRWLRGGLYNRIKHIYLLNGLKYGDFGILAIVLDMILFIPIALMLIGPVVNFFLKDHWLARMGVGSVFYSIDALWFIGIFITIISLIWFVYVWKYMRKFTSDYKINWWIWPLHLFVYSAAWGYVWLFVLWEEITRKKQSWATRVEGEEANAKKT